jgi:putative ribosome biogenesis GTPase RsgA
MPCARHFRKERIVPAVGDRVRFEIAENEENLIVEIFREKVI